MNDTEAKILLGIISFDIVSSLIWTTPWKPLKANIVTSNRSITADDFFTGLFETALQDGEVITQIEVPVLAESTGAAYAKFFNPASRYAVVGVGVSLDMNGGTCESASVGITNSSVISVTSDTKIFPRLSIK